MNDEKRAALVEELAEAMYVGVRGDGVPREREEGAPTWAEAVVTVYRRLDALAIMPIIDGRQHAVTVYRRLDALAIMPIIDRLLASRDIDAMLVELILANPGEWEASVWLSGMDWSYEEPIATGTGPTRTAAIADACKRALEGRGDER